ncbi:hypothetical protein [Bacillus sp. XF8]|uniref:hypothetical protein n=1 Tax=Bacillus sp. XF8 TaxID=2819289 RepID=UPI001AA01BA8|nr:hypothetical protein [Bacillus sp. XF8]MBO1582808.1 hypothetical protein [Bacillus sp. XF8]
MKKVLFTLATTALLFTGCSSKEDERVKELTKEIEELKKTEGGTASKSWDKQTIKDFMNKANEILKESKNGVPTISDMELQVTQLKNAFLEVKKERLPRDYEDALYNVLSKSDMLYLTHSLGLPDDKATEALKKSIETVKTTSKRFEY